MSASEREELQRLRLESAARKIVDAERAAADSDDGELVTEQERSSAMATLSHEVRARLERQTGATKRAVLDALVAQQRKVEASKQAKAAAVTARLSPEEREVLARSDPAKPRQNRPTSVGSTFQMPQNMSQAEAAALVAELLGKAGA